ncbi:MAG TPA: hypothetical protein VES20_22190, partial [Bryobacteraceae bacterium]|nr:hypothetical protein [Bryobacteraceae bacterium]
MKPATVVAALALLYASAPGAEPETIAITNVTVINPSLNSSATEMTVVLRGGRIATVGRSTRLPAGSQVVEGRGKYLVPGLADAHMHPYPAPTTGDVKETKELVANLL